MRIYKFYYYFFRWTSFSLPATSDFDDFSVYCSEFFSEMLLPPGFKSAKSILITEESCWSIADIWLCNYNNTFLNHIPVKLIIHNEFSSIPSYLLPDISLMQNYHPFLNRRKFTINSSIKELGQIYNNTASWFLSLFCWDHKAINTLNNSNIYFLFHKFIGVSIKIHANIETKSLIKIYNTIL